MAAVDCVSSDFPQDHIYYDLFMVYTSPASSDLLRGLCLTTQGIFSQLRDPHIKHPWLCTLGLSFNLMVHKRFSPNVYHKCIILVLDNMVLSSTNVLSHIHSFPEPQVECPQQMQLQLNQCPQQYHRIVQYPPQCSSIWLFRQFFRIINMSTNEVHITFSKLKIPLTSNKILQLNFQEYLKHFLPKTIKQGKISELAQSHSNLINFKRHRSLTSSIWMVSVVESKVDIQPSPTDVHFQS